MEDEKLIPYSNAATWPPSTHKQLCVCVCVCVCECVFACVCLRACACVNLCTLLCLLIHIYIHTHICIYFLFLFFFPMVVMFSDDHGVVCILHSVYGVFCVKAVFSVKGQVHTLTD